MRISCASGAIGVFGNFRPQVLLPQKGSRRGTSAYLSQQLSCSSVCSTWWAVKATTDKMYLRFALVRHPCWLSAPGTRYCTHGKTLWQHDGLAQVIVIIIAPSMSSRYQDLECRRWLEFSEILLPIVLSFLHSYKSVHPSIHPSLISQ